MPRFSKGPWHIEEENGTYGVFAGESLIALIVPEDTQDKAIERANATLIASAPLLLDACRRVEELLGNNLVVTRDGFKIDTADLRGILTDAIYRACGYRTDTPN